MNPLENSPPNEPIDIKSKRRAELCKLWRELELSDPVTAENADRIRQLSSHTQDYETYFEAHNFELECHAGANDLHASNLDDVALAAAQYEKERKCHKQKRKNEKRRIRKEGRDAFYAQKPPDSCPYMRNSPNHLQWLKGYLRMAC